jgi:hypothetical protein
MNPTMQPNDPEQTDVALEKFVQEAGECLVAPRPEHAAKVRAAIAAQTRRPVPRQGGRVSPRVLYGIAGGVLAAATVLLVAMLAWPQSGWAEVTAALKTQPWIHGVTKLPGDRQREFWISLPREVLAEKVEERTVFEDARLGVRYEYWQQRRELVRVPADKRVGFASLAGVFTALLRGDESLGSQLAGGEIVEQRREVVKEEGRTWHDYVVQLRRNDQTAVATIRVNPERKLPVWLSVKVDKEEARVDFDYPEEGPLDIYALGVPREAKVVDRLPPRKLASILADLNAQRERLDNYFVIVGYGQGYPKLIGWKKGDRWRTEVCVFRPGWKSRKLPADDAEWDNYWREEVQAFDTMPLYVCDGKTTWQWEALDPTKPREGSWKQAFPTHDRASEIALLTYPAIEPSSAGTLDLVPDAEGGPPGAILIQRKFSVPNVDNFYRQTRFWIDPDKRHAVVQFEFFDNPAIDRDPTSLPMHRHEVNVFERFVKSPLGVWYPTIVRRRAGGEAGDAPKDESQYTTHYQLDFEAELPDSLFKPQWRAD